MPKDEREDEREDGREDDGRDEGNRQRSDAKPNDEMLRRLTDEVTAKVAEQFKSQIAGLDKRVTELTKERDGLKTQLDEKDQASKTVEQQIADLRAERERDRREAQMREKKSMWRTEAVKRRLDETIADVLDSSLSVEDGLKALDALQSNATKTAQEIVNEKLGKQRAPGSGNEPDDEKARNDEDLSFDELVAKEQKELDEAERRANGGEPPGIGIR